METRKIQLTGGSTYTVSLPKEWASENDLDAGTRVDLYPHGDGSLVLRTSVRSNGGADPLRIRADRLSEEGVARAIRAAYASGYDAIAIRSLKDRRRRVIRAVAGTMIGLEVVEETDDRMVLKSLLDPADVSIRQSLLQLQHVTDSMQRDAIDAFLAGDADRAGHVVERDDEADRLYGMIARHFRRALTDLGELDDLGVDRPTLFDYYTAARQLERVADHAEKVATVATRLSAPPGDVGDEIAAHARTAREIVARATSTLLGTDDVAVAFETLDDRDAVTGDLDALLRDLYDEGAPDQYPLTLVVDSLSRTAEYGGNVAETAIRAAARRGDL